MYVCSVLHTQWRSNLPVVAGIFYALTLHIYGFVPPCRCLMARLPLSRCRTTGKAEPFFYFRPANIFVMSKLTQKCLNGKSISRSNRPALVTGKSYYHRYLSEARAKNQAYAFILSQGLLSEFILFSRTRKSDIETVKRRIDLILERVTREVNRDFNAQKSDL